MTKDGNDGQRPLCPTAERIAGEVYVEPHPTLRQVMAVPFDAIELELALLWPKDASPGSPQAPPGS